MNPDATEPVDTLAASLQLDSQETDDQPQDVAPAEVEETEAATPEVAEEEQGFDTPFNLADVDESYREHVERYNKQLQAAYTRKTQELASQRAEVEHLTRFADAINDETTREQALRVFLDQLGYELDADDEAELAQGEDENYDEYLARIEQLEQQLAAQQQAVAAQEEESWNAEVSSWVEQTLEWHAGTQGLEALPDMDRNAILTLVSTLPPDEDGMPDVHGAIVQHEANKAAVIQGYLDTKRTPAVDLSGSTGASQMNLTDDKSRLAAMNQIASRHVG